MPATSAVFLVELIGALFACGLIAGVWTVVAMAVSLSWIDELSGRGVGSLRMTGLDERDRDQGQAQVAYFLDQAVQRRLVGYRAVDDGGAVATAGKAHAVEPGSPPAVEVALEADLIAPRATVVVGRYLAHGAPFAGVRLAGSPPPCERFWL